MKKSRILSIMLALAMVLTFMPAMASAETVEGVSLYYRSGDTTNHKSSEGSINMFTGTVTEKPTMMGRTNKSVVWYELNTTTSDKKVTWSTSNAGIVAFDKAGTATTTTSGSAGTGYAKARCVNIYAIGEGNATITVNYSICNGAGRNRRGIFADKHHIPASGSCRRNYCQ